MTTTTIPREAGEVDPFYRYRRPVVTVTHVNKKGGQTLVTNLDALCHSIDQTRARLKAHLQKQLGLSITIVSGNTATKKALCIPGLHNAADIDDCVEKFVVAHVLCRQCGNPETGSGTCHACGCSV